MSWIQSSDLNLYRKKIHAGDLWKKDIKCNNTSEGR